MRSDDSENGFLKGIWEKLNEAKEELESLLDSSSKKMEDEDTESTISTMSVSTKSSVVGPPSAKTSLSDGGRQSWVRLNVGGHIFQTTRQTLCRDAGSFLARLCREDSDLPSERDDTGAFLVDRDPQYFSPVLNYLRHGKLVINPGVSEEGVAEEADFYNLPTLSALCQERIAAREARKTTGTKHVYRVLQCHEDELTSVVSAMSDGWRFEQLVPTSVGAAFASDSQQEYLCVVSRECPDAGDGGDASCDRANVLQQKARHN